MRTPGVMKLHEGGLGLMQCFLGRLVAVLRVQEAQACWSSGGYAQGSLGRPPEAACSLRGVGVPLGARMQKQKGVTLRLPRRVPIPTRVPLPMSVLWEPRGVGACRAYRVKYLCFLMLLALVAGDFRFCATSPRR